MRQVLRRLKRCLRSRGRNRVDNTIVQLYYSCMNWITTNIRIPEDLYMELKMEAAHTRQSVAQVIRMRLGKGKKTEKKMTGVEFLGKLASYKLKKGPKDLAENHDKYTWE